MDCTTVAFQGMITVMDPTASWAAKWLHVCEQPSSPARASCLVRMHADEVTRHAALSGWHAADCMRASCNLAWLLLAKSAEAGLHEPASMRLPRVVLDTRDAGCQGAGVILTHAGVCCLGSKIRAGVLRIVSAERPASTHRRHPGRAQDLMAQDSGLRDALISRMQISRRK